MRTTLEIGIELSKVILVAVPTNTVVSSIYCCFCEHVVCLASLSDLLATSISQSAPPSLAGVAQFRQVLPPLSSLATFPTGLDDSGAVYQRSKPSG